MDQVTLSLAELTRLAGRLSSEPAWLLAPEEQQRLVAVLAIVRQLLGERDVAGAHEVTNADDGTARISVELAPETAVKVGLGAGATPPGTPSGSHPVAVHHKIGGEEPETGGGLGTKIGPTPGAEAEPDSGLGTKIGPAPGEPTPTPSDGDVDPTP